MTAPVVGNPSLLLHTVENLADFHREYERFYAGAPDSRAGELQRHVGALHALADRWAHPRPLQVTVLHRPDAEGSDDGSPVEIEGLFLPVGEGDAPELQRVAQDLRRLGAEWLATGQWMSDAMAAAWAAATALVEIGALVDLLADRHRIIANDWQAAATTTVAGHLLDRAAEILDRTDLTPAGVRAGLADGAQGPSLLYAAADLVTRAGELLVESTALVSDNEQRWRSFHDRVAGLLAEQPAVPAPRVTEQSA